MDDTLESSSEITGGTNVEASENAPEAVVEPKESDMEAKESVEANKDVSEEIEDGQKTNEENDENLIFKHITKKRKAILESDSEDDSQERDIPSIVQEELNENNEQYEVQSKSRLMKIIDSDDEDDVITPHNKSFDDNLTKENNIDSHKSRLSALCDSESSDDDYERREAEYSNNNLENNPQSTSGNEELKPKKYKKKSKKDESEESQKMTAKLALEQKKEILSESCRRQREKEISLPYHKPKQRTIKEFLSKRPKIADATLKEVTRVRPSEAIKMTPYQLELFYKKLEEREKVVVEEFYKSDSESEGDTPTETEDTNKEKTTPNTETLNDNNVADNDKDIAMNDQDSNNVDEDQNNKHIGELQHSSEDISSENTNANTDFEFSLETTDMTENIEKSGHQIQETTVEKTPGQMKLRKLLDEFDFPSITDVDKDGPQSEDTADVMEVENNPIGEEETPKEVEEPKMSKLELLKQKLKNIKPRLSGGPGQIIDLDEGVAIPDEVSKFKEKVIKNASATVTPNHKVQLDIITVSGGEIHKETLAMSVEQDEHPAVLNEKPGAKLLKLKNQLENQMAQRRSELWQQKHNKTEQTNDEEDGEKSECGAKDILDDEEEFEDDGESDSSETDEEVEDIDISGKPRKPKSAFVEEEADEDDREESDPWDGIEAGNDEDEEEADIEEDSEDEVVGEVTPSGKKQLKRIVKAFDSDDSDDDMQTCMGEICKKVDEVLDKNLDSRGSWEDDETLPPNRPATDRTPRRDLTQSKPDLSFLTPIGHLTGLQGSTSASKFLSESPIVSQFQLPAEPSPLRSIRPSQKNLFGENEDPPSTQEIAELCSGKFPNISEETARQEDDSALIQVDPTQVSSQELLDLCSGDFSSTTNQATQKPDGTQKNVEIFMTQNGNEEIKTLGCDNNEDKLISQLLDEEELNNFKKKFDTPLKSAGQMEGDGEEAEDGSRVGRVLYDSNDEDDAIAEGLQRKRKAKIVYSDSESENGEETFQPDEEIDLHNNTDDDEEMEVQDEPQEVDYDSEENEIEAIEAPKEVYKPGDFLENEAELSESEWGSADEDEKEADHFEAEAGDADVFDDRKIRRDLEKIHMRQVLDEDNREVKILQEMYLEDGEMHGTGRQRQFKWRNIDAVGDEIEDKKDDDDDIYFDEEENELEWRKKRHEREEFLKKNSQNRDDDEEDNHLLSTSQLLKLGQKAVILNENSSKNNTPNEKPKTANSPDVKLPFALSHQRGSLLTRSERVLQKLAEFSTKIADSNVVNTAKGSRNFVFQTVGSVSLESETTVLKFDKKRKASDGTPKVIKKLRLSNNFSPANKKKSKTSTNGLFNSIS